MGKESKNIISDPSSALFFNQLGAGPVEPMLVEESKGDPLESESMLVGESTGDPLQFEPMLVAESLGKGRRTPGYP